MTSFNALDKITEVATANGNALKSAVEIGLNATEQLFALQLNTFRSLSAGSAPATGGNPFEQMAAQFKVPTQALEQMTDYFRGVSEILVRTQAEFARLHGERFNETIESFKQMLDGIAKSGPSGSAEIVSQMKTALSSVTEAYENIIRTTQEATETQLAAASSALQPIGARSKVTKKAA